jgi:hypothetical protein
VPLHIVFPSSGPIELWDSGVPVQARGGDTVASLAAAYHVPAWAVAQINQKPENASLSEGQRVVIPRMVGQKLARGEPAGEKPASSSAPSAAPAAAASSPPPAESAAPAEKAAPSQAANPAPAASAPAPAAAPSAAASAAPAPKPAPSAASSASQINQ